MKKPAWHYLCLCILSFFTLSAGAAFYGDYPYANATLKGLKTIAVNIDPPRGSDYGELSRYGVTSEQLQEMISARLRDAGFKVISFTESLEDPDAVMLDLLVRVDIPWGSYYAYDIKLSVNQKLSLAHGKNSFYSVKTWSDRQIGALQQAGPGLYPLYGYSMQLVENFIKAHQAQN